jgi:DNA repair exonuclease SbcCD nuclease subunit
MFTFIHAADLHLDSPLRGLPDYDGAPSSEIRGATRCALTNLVDLAISEEVAFVIIAGDLYDGDWRDYNTGLFLISELRRLRDADIPVYIVAGNHDAVSNITKSLRLPDNVNMFSTRKPETKKIDSINVALHGQSFEARELNENIAALYPPCQPGYFNIGILHTSADGQYEHGTYAPCSVDTMIARGYDYWALGHVHNYVELNKNPWIVFPGNTQGRHVRETGVKGCALVTVDDGVVTSVEHRELDVLRWSVIEINVDGLDQSSLVLERVKQVLSDFESDIDRLHAVRIYLKGHTLVHNTLHADNIHWTNEIRAIANDVGNGMLWVEELRVDTAKPQQSSTIEANDTINDLLHTISAWSLDDDKLHELSEEFQTIALKLPYELRVGAEGEEALDPLKNDAVRAALLDVGNILQDRLNISRGNV